MRLGLDHELHFYETGKMRSHSYEKVITLQTAIFIALAIGAAHVHAADATWTGATSTAWNSALNWLTVPPGGIPANGDGLIFDSAAPVNQPSNNNISGLTLSNINFDALAGSHTLGGNGINLGWRTTGTGTLYEGNITNNSAANQTVNNPITLDIARHVFSTQANALNLNGPITQTKNSVARFLNGGGGAINLTGSGLANTNGILGGWATVGNNAGFPAIVNDWATLDGSNNVVPYTAYTEVADGGTIADGPATNVRITAASTTAVTMAAAGDTHINTLMLGPSGTASNLTVGTGNRLVLGQNGGIFNASAGNGNTNRNLTIDTTAGGLGTITAGDGVNPATITITGANISPNNTGIMNINSHITDNGSAKVSVVVTGGYVTPNAASVNTFSGGLYILSGRWSQPNGTSIGAGPVYIFPGGLINPGAGTPVTIANDLFIAGNGSDENAGQGAIRMFQNTSGNATQITGTITLMADASINSNGLTQAQHLANRYVGVSGKITGPGGLGLGSPVTTANAGSGIVIIGPISGPGVKSDYSGDTTINGAGGTVAAGLKIGNPDADNILPHGATGSYSGGPTGNIILNSVSGSTRSALFDLNGSQQIINGLSNTASDPLNDFVQSSLPNGHLVIGDSNATATFDGIIRDNDGVATTGTLAITKIGTGTQTLTALSTYTGQTRVNGGVLSITNAYLADTSNVGVGGSGVLDLNFVGSDTVSAFYLNGSPQASGTWGSLTSTATHKTARISGTGILDVASVGLLYGDYNSDGKVDAADIVVWRENEGTANVLPNDAIGGTIGKYQYRQWAANFGASIGGSGGGLELSAVPEPGAAALALLAAVACGCIRGRRGV